MGELILTDQRRAELSRLLSDAQRLREEYPKAADYWERAATLPGTGDPHADAAFDLRFLHYMTGGEADSGNPYWEVVEPAVSTRDRRRVVDGGGPDGSARLGYAQTLLQEAFAYAIPSPETVAWIAEFCGDRAVVEHGAGRGYWAHQLARAGLTVDAFDSEPPDQVWHEVGDADAFTHRIDTSSDDVLFLCWPPGWGNTMASDALDAFEAAGGTRLVLVGEPRGGMTGDAAFFDRLSAAWELRTEDAGFVSWWNLSDVAQAWARR